MFIDIRLTELLYIKLTISVCERGSPCGVIIKALNFGIEISKFELQ